MKNIYETLYNYNLDCVLYNSEEKKELGSFKACEYTERNTTSGFVHGGISSGGQNYAIATLDEIIKQANDVSTVVFVEGVKYILAGKRVQIISSPIAPKVVQYVLILE